MLDEQIAALVAEREQRRGGADRFRGRARAGDRRALPAAQRRRAHRSFGASRRASLAASIRAELEAARSYDPSASVELEAAARDAATYAQSAAGERARLQVEAEERWARVAAIERGAQTRAAGRARRRARTPRRDRGLLTGGGRDALLRCAAPRSALGVRQESAQRLLAELQLELVEARQVPSGPTPAELGRAADEADAAARAALREREDLEARVTHGARAPRCARAVARRARGHAAGGPRARRGRRAARAAAARGRGGHASARSPPRSAIAPPRSSRRARSAASSSIGQAMDAGPRLAARARRPRPAPARRPAGRPARRSCSPRPCPRSPPTGSAGTRSAASSGSRARRPRPSCSSSTPAAASCTPRWRQLARRADEAAGRAEQAAARARAAADAFAPVAHLRDVPRADPARLERLVAGAERLDETLRVAAAAAARLETPLAERAGRLAERPARDRRRARPSCGARSPTPTAARSPPSGARTAAAPRRAATSHELRVQAEELSALAAEAAKAADDAAERARAAARALAESDPGRTRRPSELVLERLQRGAERLEACARASTSTASRRRFASGPRRRRRARPSSAQRCAGSGPTEVEVRQRASQAGERLAAIDVELARTDAERDEAQRGSTLPRPSRPRARTATSSPRSSPATSAAASSSARSTRSRRRSTRPRRCGCEELSVQRADLEKSLDELEKLRDDLTRTVETRFAETFAAVEHHFHEVAATLFPGGEGRLRHDRGGGRRRRGARDRGRAAARPASA